jgi:hypothetical protein
LRSLIEVHLHLPSKIKLGCNVQVIVRDGCSDADGHVHHISGDRDIAAGIVMSALAGSIVRVGVPLTQAPVLMIAVPDSTFCSDGGHQPDHTDAQEGSITRSVDSEAL